MSEGKEKRSWASRKMTNALKKEKEEKKKKKSKPKRRVGRPTNPPSPEKMLRDILPVEDIFDENELVMYRDLVKVYMADFDAEELTSGDMDDILDLAKNRVLEFRLLRDAKGNPDRQLDVAKTVEGLSKKNEKLKESLFFRRKDRITPNEFKGFSIVDLVVAFDDEKKEKLQKKVRKLKLEEKALLKRREAYKGNRHDVDIGESENTDE